jgi:hypothetical protein
MDGTREPVVTGGMRRSFRGTVPHWGNTPGLDAIGHSRPEGRRCVRLLLISGLVSVPISCFGIPSRTRQTRCDPTLPSHSDDY